MKKIYIAPQVEIIDVGSEQGIMSTSRFSDVGNTGSPNSNKDHYGDPTGSIEGIDGGESLSKWNAWDIE